MPDEAAIRIEGRDGHDGQRSNGGDVWASICGFDSVFDGPGRFALDRADLRQKYDDLRRFYA